GSGRSSSVTTGRRRRTIDFRFRISDFRFERASVSENLQSEICNLKFEHERHKPPSPLTRPRELVLCCAPMRSNVNLSNMVRTAGCCGITRVIACGSPKIDKSIARDGADQVEIEVHRT